MGQLNSVGQTLEIRFIRQKFIVNLIKESDCCNKQDHMLAKLSHSARAGKIVRMFCKPAHGVNTPFTTHTSLDTLLKQIDGDKPMLYCLLITESWHPE